MTDTIRFRGRWSDMTAAERDDLTTRGLAKIFDQGLRVSIAELVDDVRRHGDAALLRALESFDRVEIGADRIRVAPEEFASARASIPGELLAAIRDSIDHVRRFNEQVLAHTGGAWTFEIEPGVTVGEISMPIASAGLFVPSGKGSYPSVLIQLGTPAIVAGVRELAVVVPPVPGSDGKVDAAVLVAADELGIANVFRANGPAGIAALAFGTETVPRVRKIAGPGSPPVAAAQLEVQRHGTVGVQLLGPSESLILADDSADPFLLAADLLNEAEHGPDSSSVLVTDSPVLVDAVDAELGRQLVELPEERAGFARQALQNGGVVLVDDLEEGAEVANAYAPEHMQLVSRDEDAIVPLIVDAGELLLGQDTTISMANFVLGIPASLPTSGYAKVSSGITVEAFRKRTAVAKATRAALERMSKTVLPFTAHEGFPAHGLAVSRRLGYSRAGADAG